MCGLLSITPHMEDASVKHTVPWKMTNLLSVTFMQDGCLEEKNGWVQGRDTSIKQLGCFTHDVIKTPNVFDGDLSCIMCMKFWAGSEFATSPNEVC